MRKVPMAFLLLSSVAFGQCMFELVETGFPEQVRAALSNGAEVECRDFLGRLPAGN